jgi:hypothetical protein
VIASSEISPLVYLLIMVGLVLLVDDLAEMGVISGIVGH